MNTLNFIHDEKKLNFSNSTKKGLYSNVIQWLFDNGYQFKNNNIQRRLLSDNEVRDLISRSNMRVDKFYKIKGTDFYVVTNFIKNFEDLIYMLEDFGVKSIKVSGDLEIARDVSPLTENKKNPFRQSICVIGESGAGKSVTIKNILDHEQHAYDFIIPSALSGNLLVQYSPSKSEYKLSKLGNMIVDAHNDPSKLYTMVIDEMHKSHVIEMINDELLQAISTKRNKYRFISLDPDSTKLFVEKMGEGVLRAGNIVIPDNFGIIFISSKKEVILSNEDLFNRVDLILLTDQDWNIKTAADLLKKVIPEEEKKSLKRF